MQKYTLAIIGAGSIGALKDDKYDTPTTENILTHAHAAHTHPQIDLIGIIDTDITKAKKAAQKWSTEAYGGVFEMYPRQVPDIIVVACDTGSHYSVLSKIALNQQRPKLVVVEKPFCENSNECKEIINLYKEKGVPLVVDYIRRFDPLHQTLVGCLLPEHIFNCRVYYNRGLKHEGCHAIDLMNWYFGRCESAQQFNAALCFADGPDKTDKTVTALMEYEYCDNVVFLPLSGDNYSIFDIEFMGVSSRYHLTDHGKRLYEFSAVPEPTYGDYKTISSVSDVMCDVGELTKALYHLLDNAVLHLMQGDRLKCTGEDALKVHQVLEMVKRSGLNS